MTGHHEAHHHHGDAAAAAKAQREASVIGWVDGVPIPRERLDSRVRDLRAGTLAARLPALGSKEDRQFLRWTAQVLLTEELCRAELAESSVTAPARRLTPAESLHLGSINAAAWSASPEMSALYQRVTAATPPASVPTDTRTWYRVTHAVGASPLEAATVPETSLGWTTLSDLPAPLATALRARPVGTRVGPVRTGIGWHFATVTATEERPVQTAQQAGRGPTDPTRLAAFNRWLDQERRARVIHAEGFEHPGDPSQPDNTHRH